jgi:class 3 adenylate cyclase
MPVSRRTVTVLFCDVVGWTSMSASLDAEVLRERQSGYHSEARAVLERHGGTVEKFIGDAVMAVFGWPRARADDALRAVRAAAELRDRLPDLQVRIGINTGEVAAGDGDALVTGDAVNRAKRLEQAADTGTILVGPATYSLVRGAVELEALPPIWLKGIEEPVEVWRLGALLGDAGPYTRRLDAPFVGRRGELARLHAELEAAREGRCRLVTVVGPPGVGKSRLAHELGEAVRADARVLTGRCLSYGEGITYWPLEEIVREAGGDPAALAAHGERLFPEVRRYLEELAAERPLVLVLEDIHWAEPTLLDLLEYVAGWSAAPILLVCLARDDLFEKRPDWPRETVVTLRPLSRVEADALVLHLSGDLDADLRRRIGEVADGNPLFAEQLAAAAAEGELTVPPTLQALLSERLDRLSSEERTILEQAAVIGGDFSHASVAALVPDELAASVRSLLLGLVRKDVIRPAGGDEGFAFRHVLIRDAAYASVPKRTRARLHAQVAAQSASDELRGYHFEQAHRYSIELGEEDGHFAAQAASALASAGSRAYDRSDMPAALNLLERALELGSDDDPGRPELGRKLALALLETGDAARAAEGLALAIRAAERAGDRRVEWIARLDAAQRGHEAADLHSVATEAVAVFEDLGDEAGLAHAWRRLAVSALRACSYAEAQRAAELALGHARSAGETHQVGRTVDQLCTSLLYGPAPADEAAGRCRQLLAEAHGDPLVEANVLSSLSGLEAMLGRFDEARQLAGRARTSFERLGLRRLDAGLSEIEGEIEQLAGDPSAAERAYRRGLELVDGAEARLLAVLLADAVLLQGRTDEAERLAADAGELVTGDAVAARVRLLSLEARLLALRGEQEAASARARTAVELAARTDALSLQGDAHAALAEVSGDERARSEALRRYEAKRNRAAAGRVRRSLLLEA